MISLPGVSWLRIGAAVAIAVALASSHWWAYRQGAHHVHIE